MPMSLDRAIEVVKKREKGSYKLTHDENTLYCATCVAMSPNARITLQNLSAISSISISHAIHIPDRGGKRRRERENTNNLPPNNHKLETSRLRAPSHKDRTQSIH